METLTIAVAEIDSYISSFLQESIAIHSSFKIIGEAKTGEELFFYKNLLLFILVLR